MATEKDALGKYVIVSAALVGSDRAVFGAHQDNAKSGIYGERWNQRLIGHRFEAGNWGWVEYDGGFQWVKTAGGLGRDGAPQAIFASASGYVYHIGYEAGNAQEANMPMRGLSGLEFIGEHFYAIAGGRGFARRTGPDTWEVFSHTPWKDEETDPGSFELLDGRAEDDIYLWFQGPTRQAWVEHWDGSDFTPIPMERSIFENTPISPFAARSMHVAPDGTVYVGGAYGELAAGNRETGFVSLIPQRSKNIGSIDGLAMFKGTLYAATQTALWAYDPGTRSWAFKRFEGDEDAPISFGMIDMSEDRLLVAGHSGASVYDGQSWTRIAGGVTSLHIAQMELTGALVEDTTECFERLRNKVDHL